MSYDDYDDSEGEEVQASEEEVEEESEEEVKPKKQRRQKKWKDPNKPKRAMSAFFLYSQANRPVVKEENPSASFGNIARILAAQFKDLPDSEKVKWNKKAEEEKARYVREMEDYVPMEDPTGGRGKKKKKDPNAPKRNCSAYFLFSVHERPRVKEDNPDASFGDIARLISARFKALPASERAKWDKKAVEDKERYVREMAEYRGEA